MATVVSAQRKIHYLDEGAGPLVALVHSGGMSSRQWSRLTPRLITDHRVLVPDLLGSGASDPVPADAPFDYNADVDALSAMLATSDQPCHLVGHSYGGLVALTWARRNPARVRSLAVYEPVAFGVLYSADDTDGIHNLDSYDPDGTFFDDAAGGKEPWLENFIDYWNGRGAWRGLPESSRAGFLKVGRKVFQEVRSLMSDRTPHDAYASIAAPTLLMSGGASTLAAQRVCAVLGQTIPHAEVATFEGVGHMGPLTHAQVVNDRIVAHIQAADAG